MGIISESETSCTFIFWSQHLHLNSTITGSQKSLSLKESFNSWISPIVANWSAFAPKWSSGLQTRKETSQWAKQACWKSWKESDWEWVTIRSISCCLTWSREAPVLNMKITCNVYRHSRLTQKNTPFPHPEHMFSGVCYSLEKSANKSSLKPVNFSQTLPNLIILSNTTTLLIFVQRSVDNLNLSK